MRAENQPIYEVIQLVEEGLRRNLHRLIPPERGVLLAVSGGPDSMTLLSAMTRIVGRSGTRFEAATIDHELRPESKAEVALVARTAAMLGVTHHVRVAPPATGGIEAGARVARYAALEALRRERGLDFIVTAHTASDQAETLLMRLSRGASLTGAGAILEHRDDQVIRPMLFVTRAEVEAYVTALGLEVARDAMNDDRNFLRTRFRQDVLPTLHAAAGEGVERALARFASLAAEDDDELQQQARAALTRCRWPDGSLEAIAVTSLSRAIARRVMALWLLEHHVELDTELIDACLRAARNRSVTALPGDRVLICTDGRVNVAVAPPRLHATS
ncbi:MAG: tRNA lysidine(34) synthetase TilS [Archangium sp.]